MVTMPEQKKDKSMFSSIPVDTKHKVTSFDMIGWTDPDKPNPQKTIKWLKSLTHETFIYPMTTFDPEKPPSCIFVPEQDIMFKMIETVARNQKNKDMLYAKFSDMQHRKPQWLIDLEAEKAV